MVCRIVGEVFLYFYHLGAPFSAVFSGAYVAWTEIDKYITFILQVRAMDNQKIKEICDVAEGYLVQLKELENENNRGLKQILDTAEAAEEVLMRRFSTLQDHINNLLSKRKCVLLEKILNVSTERTSQPL